MRRIVALFAVILIVGTGVVLYNYRSWFRPAPGGSKSEAPAPLTFPPVSNSMVSVDYPALWNKHDGTEPDPKEEMQHFLELILYGTHPEAYLAAEVVGGGPAGPLGAAARVWVQPDVVKATQAAAATKPLTLTGLGGTTYDQRNLDLQGGGSRRVVLTIRSPAAELDRSILGFVQAVVGVVGEMGGQASDLKVESNPCSRWEFAYTLSGRSGTFAARLLLPDANTQAIDFVVPPSDQLGRIVLQGRPKDQSMLVVAVEEK